MILDKSTMVDRTSRSCCNWQDLKGGFYLFHRYGSLMWAIGVSNVYVVNAFAQISLKL